MKRVVMMCLLQSFIATLYAQNLSEFQYFTRYYNDDTYIDIGLSRTFLSNNDAPRSEMHRQSGTSGTIRLRRVAFEKGAYQYFYENKLVCDMILLLDKVIDNPNNVYRSESSGLSNGILGWYTGVGNVISNDRLCVGVGGNIKDYFLTSAYEVDSVQNGLVPLEPGGYWFAAGPSATVDVSLTDFMIAHGYISYSIGFWRAADVDDFREIEGYPTPHFGSAALQLQSKWGAFLAIEHNWLINRGSVPNNTKRTDLLLGFKFPI